MGSITTAMLASAKRDFLNGIHCFAQSRSFTCTSTSTATVVGVSPPLAVATPVIRGEQVSGTNVSAGTVVARILSSTSIQLNQAPSAAITAFTVAGDVFKMALIQGTPTGNYSVTNTNYTDITGNSDETTGTGYTAGGQALTNVDPIATSPSAFTNFSPNPTWVSSSFSTSGCMIYNSTQNGPIATPGVSVHSFGGIQTVASGTFTAVMPTAAVGTAVLQIT